MPQTTRRIRRAYRFAGYVQGVGFRWLARTAAEPLGLTGFVQNEADGTVYLEAQGDPAAHERLLTTLYQGRYLQIERMESRPLPLVEGERGFRIRD